MATTTNYSWTTPDDTDLVKDGASAIRTLGSSADTTVKNLNPGTTAGDIDYYTSSTAKARVAIGTAGQFLAVNSGATAPEWVAAPTSASNFSLVNAGGTATTSGQEVTISSITNANKLLILCVGNSSTIGLSSFFIKINGDSGANYYQNGIAFDVGNTYSDQKIARGEGINPATNGFYLAQMSGVAGSVFNGYMLIDGGNSAGVKVVSASGGTSPAGSFNHLSRSFGGYYDSSSTISSVSIRTDGTFDAGTIYVYKSA